MNQTKKKRFSIICLIMVLLISVFPVTAFAYTSDDVDEVILQIKTMLQVDDNGDKDETANEIKDEIMDILENESKWSEFSIGGDDYYPKSWNDVQTRNDGYRLIEMVIYNTDADNSAITIWKSNFDQHAEEVGLGQYSTAGTSSADALETTGKKINMLTWNNTQTSDGSEYADANEGIIEKVLSAMDSGLAGSFFTTLRAIAVALTIAFGLSKILGMSTERNVSGDAITREFIKVIAGAWFIMNFKFFALLIINVGSSVLLLFIGSLGESDNADVQYSIYSGFLELCQQYNLTSIKTQWALGMGNIMNSIGGTLSNIGASLTSFIGNEVIEIASSLAVYSVLLELMIRYAFTPIAIADLYSERFRSSGWMWLKKLLACAMTGAVMYMMIWACQELTKAISHGSILSSLAINLTMISMLFRAHGIANEIVGAH